MLSTTDVVVSFFTLEEKKTTAPSYLGTKKETIRLALCLIASLSILVLVFLKMPLLGPRAPSAVIQAPGPLPGTAPVASHEAAIAGEQPKLDLSLIHI